MCRSIRHIQFFCIIISMAALTACTSNVGGRQGSVWETYDYRHPVPGSVGMPTYGGAGGYYGDNDRSYVPPKAFGCSPDNITMCE